MKLKLFLFIVFAIFTNKARLGFWHTKQNIGNINQIGFSKTLLV